MGPGEAELGSPRSCFGHHLSWLSPALNSEPPASTGHSGSLHVPRRSKSPITHKHQHWYECHATPRCAHHATARYIHRGLEISASEAERMRQGTASRVLAGRKLLLMLDLDHTLLNSSRFGEGDEQGEGEGGRPAGRCGSWPDKVWMK